MGKYYIGVDLGGTKILAGVVNKNGKVISSHKTLTPHEKGEKEVIKTIVKTIEKAKDKCKLKSNDIKSIGIGIPGIIDIENGIIISSPNLTGWKNVNFSKEISKKISHPVYLENDVNAGTIGEFTLGAGKNSSNGLGIFIGTGIGGGIVINRSIYTGNNGYAGELGHIVIDASSDKECKCGAKGCFETLASRTSLTNAIIEKASNNPHSIIRKLSDNFKKPIKSSLIKKAYLTGDRDVSELFDKQCYYIGIACANYINIFNPEVIVLGGGLVTELGDEMVEKVSEYAKDFALAEPLSYCSIVKAEFGDYSGIVGAAIIAMKHD